MTHCHLHRRHLQIVFCGGKRVCSICSLKLKKKNENYLNGISVMYAVDGILSVVTHNNIKSHNNTESNDFLLAFSPYY